MQFFVQIILEKIHIRIVAGNSKLKHKVLQL